MGFIFLIYIMGVAGNNLYNSDSATSNIIAKEMIETKQLFPKDIVYQEDVYVLDVDKQIVILSLFTNNQVALKNISNINMMIIVIVIFFLISKYLFKDKSYLLSLALILSTMSSQFILLIFDGHYIYHLIFSNLIVLFSLLSLTDEYKIKYKNLVIASLSIFIYTLGGTRAFSYILPLVVSVGLVFIIDNNSIDKKEFFNKLKSLIIWLSIISAVSLIGLFAYKLFCKYYQVNSIKIDHISFNTELIVNNIYNSIDNILMLFGVNMYPKSSIVVLNTLFRIIVLVCMILVFPILLIKKYSTLNINIKRFLIFSSLYFIEILLIFNFYSINMTSRYFFAMVIFQITISCYYIYKYIINKNYLVDIIVGAAVTLFVLSSIYSNNNKFNIDKSEYYQEMQEFFYSNELEFGYATYWNAYSNALNMDFEPEIAAIFPMNFEPTLHLTSKRYYEPDYYYGKTFIMLNDNELETVNYEAMYKFGEPIEELRYDVYTIYVYDYNIANKFRYNFNNIEVNMPTKLNYYMSVNEHVIQSSTWNLI